MFTRVKTSDEIENMRRSGRILAEVHKILIESVKPGITTARIASIAEDEITKRGANGPFLGYGSPVPFPSVICISVNEEVVHGVPGPRVINNGDIVSLDIGVEYKGMITDAAITVICGQTSKEIQELVDRTRKALYAGLKVIKNGCTVGDIGYAIENYISKYGYGIVRDLVGHGVGHEIHEDPNIPNVGKKGTGHRLVTGMTLAIEPMITLGNYAVHVGPDHWTVATNDGSVAAHFEHTILVTDNGCEILTSC